MSKVVRYIISSNDFLLRTLPKKPDFIGENKTLTSAVFKKSKKDIDGGVSVNIEYLVLAIEEIFNKETHHIAKLSAEVPLSLGCPCVHDPILDNNAHALIMNVSNGIAKKLAREAIILSFDSPLST